jgi:hypothetical protein
MHSENATQPWEDRHKLRELRRLQAMFDQLVGEGMSEDEAVREIARRHNNADDPRVVRDLRRKVIDERLPETPSESSDLEPA